MISASPFLQLQHPIDDAAYFYARLFDGEVLAEEYTQRAQSASIRIGGQVLHLFNGGACPPPTEAISILVTCSSQDELDRIWAGLEEGGSANGGGWITDRFGVTWHVVPSGLREWLIDPQRGDHVAEVMTQLVKLDFAPLEAALRQD